MLISQQARAGIPVNHDFHPERVPNHQEWSSYSTTVTLSSSERQEHMFLLKRPDHMRCGHASIPRFPTLVGMLYHLLERRDKAAPNKPMQPTVWSGRFWLLEAIKVLSRSINVAHSSWRLMGMP